MTARPVVIVCGGRDWENRMAVYLTLERIFAKHPNVIIRHGACAEAWGIGRASARNWLARARKRGVVVSEYRGGVVTWRAK